MTDAAAIRGTFSDYKLIKTRKVLQIVVEVPIEQQAEIFAVLGYPMPDQESWVAVARLRPEKTEPEKPKKHWHDLKPSQQAYLMCMDAEFQSWLGVSSEDDAATAVRKRCNVNSRSAFDSNRIEWDRLHLQFAETTGRAAEQR